MIWVISSSLKVVSFRCLAESVGVHSAVRRGFHIASGKLLRECLTDRSVVM